MPAHFQLLKTDTATAARRGRLHESAITIQEQRDVALALSQSSIGAHKRASLVADCCGTMPKVMSVTGDSSGTASAANPFTMKNSSKVARPEIAFINVLDCTQLSGIHLPLIYSEIFVALI